MQNGYHSPLNQQDSKIPLGGVFESCHIQQDTSRAKGKP